VIARRVAIGGATNSLGKAIALGTWFVLTPFILGRLGPVSYGVWVLVGSIGAYGYLLDLGVAGAVVKYVAEFRARGDWAQAHAVVAAAWRVYAVLGVVASLLGVVVAVVVPVVLNIPPSNRAETFWSILLTGVTIGLALAFMPATAALRGLQRFDLYNVVVTSGTLLTAGATVAVLAAGGGLVGMVAVSVPITLVMQLVSVALVRRAAPELDFGWRGAWRGELTRITKFSGASFALNISGALQTRTDEVVIAAFRPVALVTPYALARRLAEIAPLVTDQFIKVLLPLSSELDAVRDAAQLRSVFVVSTRLTLGVLVPASVVLIMFGAPILTAWVGPAYAASAPLVTILTIAALFRGASWPAATLLQGMARHHRIAVLSIGSGVANLVLSIALVQPLGVVGVAYGTLIPTAIETMLVLPYGLRVVGAGLGEGLRQIALPPLVAAVPMALVLYALRGWMQPTGIDFVIPAAIGLAAYVAVYPLLDATRPEREMVRSVAVAAFRRGHGAGVR
jgi:O-antigen/teichoic acid export membrane protein